MSGGEGGDEVPHPRLTKRPFPLNPGSRCGHGLLRHTTLAEEHMLSRVIPNLRVLMRLAGHCKRCCPGVVVAEDEAEATVSPQNPCQAVQPLTVLEVKAGSTEARRSVWSARHRSAGEEWQDPGARGGPGMKPKNSKTLEHRGVPGGRPRWRIPGGVRHGPQSACGPRR